MSKCQNVKKSKSRKGEMSKGLWIEDIGSPGRYCGSAHRGHQCIGWLSPIYTCKEIANLSQFSYPRSLVSSVSCFCFTERAANDYFFIYKNHICLSANIFYKYSFFIAMGSGFSKSDSKTQGCWFGWGTRVFSSKTACVQ